MPLRAVAMSLATSRPTPGPAAEELLAVADVSRELAHGSDPQDTLVRSLRVLDRRLGVGRAVFCVADRDRRVIGVEATHGIAPEHFHLRYGMGVAGRVADSGQPIVVPSVRHDAMALSDLGDPAAWTDVPWCLVAVPVRGAGQRTGVLCAYFRQRDPAGFSGRLGVLDVVASLIWRTVDAADSRNTPTVRPPRAEERAQRAPSSAFEYSNMIGASAAMRQVYEQIGQVARTNATALLRGESGTGKEVVAHAIHHNSPRADGPFVKVNCAALPEQLFESEVFGHERGAFTGALTRKKGRFELAEGGTLFLDEIGELSPTTQAKLLRVLQFREFERLGGTETLRTDVRIVAATNKDMERAVANGTFREDLYYRINIFTITLPPLRDRRADIPLLAEYFLSKFAAEHHRKIGRISSGALDVLSQHSWPGNVRELENVMERAVVICDGFVIQEHHLPESLRRAGDLPSEGLSLADAVERLERKMVEEALHREQGNVVRAARALGTTERILRYKATKYGIDTSRFRC